MNSVNALSNVVIFSVHCCSVGYSWVNCLHCLKWIYNSIWIESIWNDSTHTNMIFVGIFTLFVLYCRYLVFTWNMQPFGLNKKKMHPVYECTSKHQNNLTYYALCVVVGCIQPADTSKCCEMFSGGHPIDGHDCLMCLFAWLHSALAGTSFVKCLYVENRE